uniref:Replication-associated protein n=1 Tax=Insect-associated mastrevirus 1 TaxID=2692405 RepID=A0A6B9KYQ0_9GEMI|nr:replicase [Insect-associated mastrevirus 1]
MQTARKVDAVRDYCKKDGDFIENWSERRKMEDILVEAESPSQFLNLIRENYPEKYVFNLEKVEYAANKLFVRPPSPYSNPNLGSSLTLTSGMEVWLNEEFVKTDRPKSLWLCGPTRTGKTTWARSLGHHIYWSGSFILDTFDESAQYLVLDDIEWSYVPAKKQLFGGQKEFVLSDKYRRKRRLKWGKPVIYLFNRDADPWNDLSAMEREWYEPNVSREYITNKLY